MDAHKLRPYKILKCDNLSEIKSEILPIILKYHDEWSEYRPWTDLGKKFVLDIIKNCPKFMAWMKQQGFNIKNLAFTVIDETDARNHLRLHIDQLPVLARVNIPILNTEDYLLQWYNIDEEYRSTLNIQEGSTDCGVDIDKATFMTEFDMSQPIVFNTQIPHMVEPITTNAKIPRIMMTCTLFKDPLEFLV